MIESVTYNPAIEKARKGSYILGIILFLGLGFAASSQMQSMLWGIVSGAIGAGGYVFLQGRKLDKLPSFTFAPDALTLAWPGGSQTIRWNDAIDMERKGSTWMIKNRDGSKARVRVLGFEPSDAQAIANRLEVHRDSVSQRPSLASNS